MKIDNILESNQTMKNMEINPEAIQDALMPKKLPKEELNPNLKEELEIFFGSQYEKDKTY